MKIIISHDVDHLYNTDHFKDLYYPKLWVRSCLEFLKREISLKEWWLRFATPFKRRMHRIDELMLFDQEHGIPSTFFFGMANGLGMSYTQQTATPVIELARSLGFDVGVHGIAYTDHDTMKKEHDDLAALIGARDFGIRMHYVRYDNSTFGKLSDIGYTFDTSEFDKAKGYTLKSPYKIGDMWEFPLCIMDTYLPYDLDDAKRVTLDVLIKAEHVGIEYLNILFHDVHFDLAYATYRDWYMWLIRMLIEREHVFVSYKQAIEDLTHPDNDMEWRA